MTAPVDPVGIAFQFFEIGKKEYKKFRQSKEWAEGQSALDRWVLALSPLLENLRGQANSDNVDSSLKKPCIVAYENCSKLRDALEEVQRDYREKRKLGLRRKFEARSKYSKIDKLRQEFDSSMKTLRHSYTLFQMSSDTQPMNRYIRLAAQLSSQLNALPDQLAEHLTMHASVIARSTSERGSRRRDTYRVVKPIPKTSARREARRSFKFFDDDRVMDMCVSKRQRQGQCLNCGTFRHFEVSCRRPCGKCFRYGHTMSECESAMACYICHGAHLSERCPRRKW
ncbi:hypothetical protein BDV41DRAFT_520133 [Aspergillus transmontanensis]|uniref:CCHC-type domain-containing protein n=1 Tax=Aspergillus transmontanensis TaxID=1034304 RepID=A0A5N6WI65_9EURO|nr:hypothetical protein BDV41DRAFT_520133 [Aspergillus transmontanensis]